MFFVFLFIFFLGLFVGSFLNVVLYRLPKRETVVFKPSYCPSCKHKLTPIELVPIFSYLIQRGKCRNCQKAISWQYPLVEATTGVLFLLAFWFWVGNYSSEGYAVFSLLYLFAISSILLLVFTFDAKYGIIPDSLVIIGSIIVLIYRLIVVFTGYSSLSFWQETVLMPLIVGLLTALFFWSIIIVTRGRGMGFGDVKLGFLLGFLVSYPDIFLLLFLAFVLGAIFSIALISFSKKKLSDTIPFGPFLVLGAYAAWFYGSKIIDLYLTLI